MGHMTTHPHPDEPGQPPRAADRARRPAARHPLARGPLDRDARRGGRDLARAALPLLRRQAGVPHRRRTPRRRRPVRRHRARRRGHPLEQLAGLAGALRRLRRRRTTTATSRWCAVRPAATRSCGRSTRSPARPSPAGSSRAPGPRRPRRSGWSTPRRSGCSSAAGRRCTEEVVIDWVRDHRGISREELLLTWRRRCRRSWRRCGAAVPGRRRREHPEPSSRRTAARSPRGWPPSARRTSSAAAR